MATYALVLTDSSKKIRDEMNARGDTVIEFPATTFLKEFDTSIFASLDAFDWIVFPDGFAALYFADAMLQSGVDLAELDYLRVAVITPETAEAVTSISIHADLIVEDRRALFEAIRTYEDREDLRILLPCAVGEEMVAPVSSNAAEVRLLPVYTRTETGALSLAKIKALMVGGAIDELVVCSITDIETLHNLFEGTDLIPILHNLRVATTSIHIADQLRRFGLEVSPMD